MSISNEQLDEMQSRCDEATEGPWVWHDGNSWRRLSVDDGHDDGGVLCPCNHPHDGHPDVKCEKNDQIFISQARTDLPACISEIRRLRKKIDAYKSMEKERWKSASKAFGIKLEKDANA